MANVPWHEEVVNFVRELVDLLPGYEIACEHEHSNCLLVAHEKVGPSFSPSSLGCFPSAERNRLEYHPALFLGSSVNQCAIAHWCALGFLVEYFAVPNLCILFLFQFKVGGEWHTWIDYDRFHQLVREYERSGGVQTFTSADYTAPTPQWAVFGARERGFDPEDTRFQRRNRTKDISGC